MSKKKIYDAYVSDEKPMSREETLKEINKMLLRDTDTLASDNLESIDRRLPTKEEFNILKLIKLMCPKCKTIDFGVWHLLSGSSDGVPTKIYWICYNHPEKSKEWPSIQYDINDLLESGSNER